MTLNKRMPPDLKYYRITYTRPYMFGNDILVRELFAGSDAEALLRFKDSSYGPGANILGVNEVSTFRK